MIYEKDILKNKHWTRHWTNMYVWVISMLRLKDSYNAIKSLLQYLGMQTTHSN